MKERIFKISNLLALNSKVTSKKRSKLRRALLKKAKI